MNGEFSDYSFFDPLLSLILSLYHFLSFFPSSSHSPIPSLRSLSPRYLRSSPVVPPRTISTRTFFFCTSSVRILSVPSRRRCVSSDALKIRGDYFHIKCCRTIPKIPRTIIGERWNGRFRDVVVLERRREH